MARKIGGIGQALKEAFSDAVNPEIPDTLSELLKRLDDPPKPKDRPK